jgi:hypothetical protein
VTYSEGERLMQDLRDLGFRPWSLQVTGNAHGYAIRMSDPKHTFFDVETTERFIALHQPAQTDDLVEG